LRALKRPQYFGQGVAGGSQLFKMDFRKRPQFLFALSRQLDQHPSAIFIIDSSAQQSELCHPVHQFDGRVVPDKKEARQISHGNRLGAGNL
jgi:hypothetical protein